MKTLLRNAIVVAGVGILFSVLTGCGHQSDQNDATSSQPANVSAPVNNNAPQASTAQGAPPPESGLPPPGGPKKRR